MIITEIPERYLLVDDTNEWWQQFEGTFGVSDDMTLNVLNGS